MKRKLIAASLAAGLLSLNLAEPANAASKKSMFNRPLNLGCSVKYEMPKFQAANSDESMNVFYSTQGKLTLQNADALAKNSYVSVNIAQPRLERKWWTLWLKKDKVNYGENRFSIRVSSHKVPWWRFFERFWDWLWDSGIYVKYAIVLTSRDEEKILEMQEVKEGQKKKEVLNRERFLKEIEKHNGKDKLDEFKETYLDKGFYGLKCDPTLDQYDSLGIFEGGHFNELRSNATIDTSLYYNKQEADELNRNIRKWKAAVLAKLAQKCGDELITKGLVAKLSSINKEQTLRLISNNNIGEGGEADKLVLILSYLALTGQSIEDDSSIRFNSCIQSVLPDRFSNPMTEADRRNIERAYKALSDAKYKPGPFTWLWNGIKYITPDIVKDFFGWAGNRFLGWLQNRNNSTEQQNSLANLAQSAADTTKTAADSANTEMRTAIQEAISAVRASQDPAQAQAHAANARTHANQAVEFAKAANATKTAAQAIQVAQELEAAMKPGADPRTLNRVIKLAKALAPAPVPGAPAAGAPAAGAPVPGALAALAALAGAPAPGAPAPGAPAPGAPAAGAPVPAPAPAPPPVVQAAEAMEALAKPAAEVAKAVKVANEVKEQVAPAPAQSQAKDENVMPVELSKDPVVNS